MAIFHTSIPKRKPRKPNAKQRQLAADWEALLKKYEPKKPIAAKPITLAAPKPYVRETPHYPSLNSGFHDTSAKASKVYTGNKMLGIGTLHKSNAVPVFSDDEAKEMARMRRG